MPFRDKSRPGWRGQVKWQGRVYRADFPSRRAAAEWEVNKRRELREQSQAPTQTVMDLETLSNEYLDHTRIHCVPHTYEKKKRICKRLLKHVGNLSVDEVTPKAIQEYLNHQARTVSTSCYNEDYAHLRAMWSWAMDILDLQINPFAKVKRLAHDRRPQYCPPTADILKVLAVATREELVFLSAYLQTGARKSEVLRWTWAEDVNFEKREVRLGTRKTRDGSMEYEWLPMNDDLYEQLWWWWNHRPIKESQLVFPSTHPLYYGQQFTSRHQFVKRLCKRAGVREFGFHALRRYVASVLADTHKVSSKTIQRILRHKNLSTTERYIKKINDDLEATMNLLGKKGSQEGFPKPQAKVKNTP